MSLPESRPVPIRVANKRAYVWDVDDVAIIRSTHRICGILTGTLPHLSQQNVFLGIPLVLMPEEVVLLVENKLAVLVDDPRAHKEPTAGQLQTWDQARKESVKQQVAQTEAKESAKETTQPAISDAAIQKRKAREERRLAQAAAAESSSANDVNIPNLPPPRPLETPSQQTENPGQTSSSNIPHAVFIPAPSAEYINWYDPTHHTYTTIDDAKAAGIWDYPATLQERAKCGVFRGLWEQGYFMGGGIKFGGDYLVYPGDPLRYHSHFSASVIESPTAALRPMEIVAHGRLGTATKKAHLLCGWNDNKKEVSYLSIEWAGF
ncbi:tRNA-intron endonuclease catalytic domain-like protein [Infundibulicybe gibba]|nr:tRNA-intron endonuclease catalytic domain-like protein [Infundibulicybe gibba]